jgi:hypothetical protein
VFGKLSSFLVILSVAGAAQAEEPSRVESAVTLFKEARAQARSGNHAAACPKFRQSYALDPAVGTLFNVADCEERDGHLVAAIRRFEDGLARLAGSDRRVSYVRTRIAALDGRIPRIFGTLGAGQRLFVDGVEIPIVPASGHLVDPGSHEIVVRRADERASVSVVLAERERKDLDFAKILPVAPVAVPMPTEDEAPPVATPEPAAARRTRDRVDLRRDREAARSSPFFRMRRDRDWRPALSVARRRVDP